MRAANQGFSLMELMITVAIIAIVSSIAIPSYQQYVKKTRRADAQGALMGLASAMERYYVDNRTFVGADPGTIFSATAPIDGSETYYVLAVDRATRRDFTVSATPQGIQADDECGTMTLSRTGVKGVVSARSTADRCWPG